jgi:homoserine kinase
MGDFVKRNAADRLGGERPGAPRALGAAVVVGAAAAVLTYRVLRQ